MLVTFKSKAAAEVTMYQEHAKRLLDLLHKDVTRGVITAAETGAALAILDAQVAASRLHPASDVLEQDVHAHHSDAGDDHGHEALEAVSFSARAYPFIEMLRAANESKADVLWGV
ncbi:hypothetical protein RCH09_000960 [Actimicrobium sp. GrIS 1.19]|uniref:DUF1840 domain-containing protein n=1 Tax=Actimicrobium sp. GrIS 1.19 TaxID=3071708 RepID=UPI002DFCBB99|nr:hypothetical protein [Actimicrobium sp. GrIS 1.19]